MDGSIELTDYDLYFYTHELREKELMDSFTTIPRSEKEDQDRYLLAHEKALLEFGQDPFTEAFEKIIHHPSVHHKL